MRKSAFNMVEIVLALGVIAIGVVSVLALVPTGLSANRDAAAETYAANAADHLLQYFKYYVEQSASNWTDYIVNNGYLDTTPLNGPTGALASTTAVAVSGAGEAGSAGTIHADATSGIYHVVAFRDVDDNDSLDAGDAIDFRCVAGVWKEPIDPDRDPMTAPIPLAYAVRLYVEVQWPTERPAVSRRKRVYTLELFNPNR
jgi:hypothetical protein